MILPKGSIMSWASLAEYAEDPKVWHAVSEHNRSELNVSVERIEKSHRLANGTLRKWHVADKRTFGTSWDMLPHNFAYTVDGNWGGEEIEEFYNDTPGDFYLSIMTPDGVGSEYHVVFKDFSKSVQKRGLYEFWTIDISLEEV